MLKNPVPWPGGARCAVCFTFDMDAESLLHLNFPDTAHRRVSTSSMLRYGPEVAVPRIVDILARHDIRQTFYVPGWCVDNYPAAIELMLEHGHEIGHHGYLHERANTLSREQEAEVLARGVESIRRATGAAPRGYRVPAYCFSENSLDLLLEHGGFEYDSSLMGDDVPYLIGNARGQLVELPCDVALDDWPQFVCSREFGYMMPIQSPQRAREVFQAEFDAAWRHGGLWISVWHPFVSGRPGRAQAMADLLDYMAGKGGVWFATMAEIAAHVKQCVDEGRWKPRVDTLPFWPAPAPGQG